MIQELENKKLFNEFQYISAEAEDIAIAFNRGKVAIDKASNFQNKKLQYLFRINEEKYFLNMEFPSEGDFDWKPIREFRDTAKKETAFAVATAYHLYQWYRDNQFCGRCGKVLVHDHRERMLKCQCGNMVYPKIAPAVIVGVTKKDKILLTKYTGRVYNRYALIAGFTEIGETAEETVKREVMEEVGVKVKNIRYYKSQPWGTDLNLLMGFFADLDGDDSITLDENELSVAEWIDRQEVPEKDDGISLTREMMRVFREGREKDV